MKFRDNLMNNDLLSDEAKDRFSDYISETLCKRVKIINDEDRVNIEYILKDLNYNYELFDKLLYTVYRIRNSIGAKNRAGYLTIPKSNYLLQVYKVFKFLNIDLIEHDNTDLRSNVIMARTAHTLLYIDKEEGDKFLNVAKDIYEIYFSDADISESMISILRLINLVEKGLLEANGKYSFDVFTDEFYSMFEYIDSVGKCNVSDLVREFYPVFGTEVFSLITNAACETSKEEISTDYMMKYLANILAKREKFDGQKDQLLEEIERIDVELENDVKKAFLNLIKSVEGNLNITNDVKKAIITNIKNVFETYKKDQCAFVEEQLESFFSNCNKYINQLIVSGRNNDEGIDDIITSLVSNCKNFFIEYDAEKFKTILKYIRENTSISTDQLREVSDKCSVLFKNADIEKLRAINSTLKKFSNDLNNEYKEGDFAEDLFERVLVNNPELLLNNNLEGVIGFLKGEISLGDCLYHHPNFAINRGFLTYDFFKKMKEDNYKILYDGSVLNVVNNLNCLSMKCDLIGIDFLNFKFTNDMIYSLLLNDFYGSSTNVVVYLKDLFDVKIIKQLIELNPELLMMPVKHLEKLATKCLLAESKEYNFYNLLASELYFYRFENVNNKTIEEMIDTDIKFIDFGIEKELDVTELLTSFIFKDTNSDDLFEQYREKCNLESDLDTYISELKSVDFNNPLQLKLVMDSVVKLYKRTYGVIPNVIVKDKIVDAFNDKKEELELQLSDLGDELTEKEDLSNSYELDAKDSEHIINSINELMTNVNSVDVRNDLKELLNKFSEKSTAKIARRKKEVSEAIDLVNDSIKLLENQVEEINDLLSIVEQDNKERIEAMILGDVTSFTIRELDAAMSPNIVSKDKELIEKALDGKNLVVFADQVDLNDIPNDYVLLDKVEKFLISEDTSILSPKFIKAHALDSSSVEKYGVPRSGIFSRKADGTQVRVYFIPVHNKYFTCYYVHAVNYKDHVHKDGGCKSDKVYKRRLSEASKLGTIINGIGDSSVVDLVEWINEQKEEYTKRVEPIVSKIEAAAKKNVIKK